MSREKALYGLTMANAIMLDLQDRVGSLEQGKDADFIVLSGDPLSVYTHVLETWVEGKKVFDRSDPKDYVIAVGGQGATTDRIVHIDCFDGDTREDKNNDQDIYKDTIKFILFPRLCVSGGDISPACDKHLGAQIAVKGETVWTMAGEPIKNGVVLVKDGKIEAVGPASQITIPAGYRIISAKVVTPGLIDAHVLSV